MKDIKEKEKELYYASLYLKNAYLNMNKKNGTYEKARELQRKQDEVWKKQQFFKKYLEEMEKQK